MLRAYRRFAILVGVVVLILLTMSVLYMLGMTHLEGKPRSFWQALQWAAGTTSTTGYSVDTSWTHPLMVVYVVFSQFMGVTLIFLVLPIFLIPLLEERFETRLPHESADARDHVLVFDYGPAVATLVARASTSMGRVLRMDGDACGNEGMATRDKVAPSIPYPHGEPCASRGCRPWGLQPRFRRAVLLAWPASWRLRGRRARESGAR